MPRGTTIINRMAAMADRREPHVLATVVATAGSVSAHAGDKALIDMAGTVLAGWVGGGCAEGSVRHAALASLADGTPRLIDIDLQDEVLGVGMPCGGTMQIFVEPLLPPAALWLTGHGRVAESLCRLGAEVGFQVIVSDTPAPDPASYPAAARLIGDDYEFEQLTPARGDAVVIATQHKGDHLSAVRALRSGAGYVAIIASGHRAGLIRDFLRSQGFPDQELLLLRTPAGLDLGARTPEEIALSVISEIIMLRRGGTGAMRSKMLDKPTAETAPVRGK